MAISFRDPDGRLFIVDGRVIRVVNRSGVSELEACLSSQTVRRFFEKGLAVRTKVLDSSAVQPLSECPALKDEFESGDVGAVLEHERIPFQNFPYEWPPEMLSAAAALTLDLANELLEEGFGLKDATPYNILFRGPQPVFVDILSFEQRAPCDPIWTPSAQFQRTFLRPLLVNKHFGIGLDQIFMTHRDGLFPEEVYRLCSQRQKLSPSFLTLVSFPALLSKPTLSQRPSVYQSRTVSTPEKALFILKRQLKGLRRKLRRVEPASNRISSWSNYTEENNYSESYLDDKQRFVQNALAREQPRRILDVGCNTGQFSLLVAETGSEVVSIDQDPLVVGELWRKASQARLPILPLVVNLSRPTPGIGWRNMESASFLERTRGAFDGVLMLALIHHMLVTERIPLTEIASLAAELTTNLLLIEYVSPEDPMFTILLRGRDQLYQHLTRDYFEQVFQKYFETIGVEQLGNTRRWLYMMKRGRDV
jgi:SAM-dependent methyltransferase